MTEHLEPAQGQLAEQVADMEGIRCRVETHIDADRTAVEPRRQGRWVGGIVDETTRLQIIEQTGCWHGSMLPRLAHRTASYSVVITLFDDTTDRLFDGDETLRSLSVQAEQCRKLGSEMYARLFAELAEDYRWGGRTYALLAGRTDTPIHDALPLRLAGAIHRVVLRGDDPRLARHYPSAGGKPGDDFPSDFIAYMREHLDEVENGLASQVQTNEVGRSVVPMVLSHWLTTIGVSEFDHLEIGASAGLNLNFDRYYAGVRTLRMGDPDAALRFSGEWFDGMPDVPRSAARVVRRRGCDPYPVDITEPEQELRLLSFVWPDQRERMDRLRSAINVAKTLPPVIDRGSADEWVAGQLMRGNERPTVVFHSIVWQYLGSATQKRLKAVLEEAGSRATAQAPLVWARMEPAGPVADVQVTVWNGSEVRTTRLAEIGYHGQSMRWLGD